MRIVGECRSLGVRVSATSVRRILRRHRIGPAPRRGGPTWTQFRRDQARGLLAVDFVTVETVGLTRWYVLFIVLANNTAIFAGFYGAFDRVLLAESSGWFGGGSRESVYRAALERALDRPARQWGAQRQVLLRHLMLGGRLPRWAGFDRGPLVLRGGRATVHQGQIFMLDGRQTTWAPSYRFVTDLGEPAAWTTLAGGASDRRFSRWYANELDDWLAGRFKRLTPTPRESAGHEQTRRRRRGGVAHYREHRD